MYKDTMIAEYMTSYLEVMDAEFSKDGLEILIRVKCVSLSDIPFPIPAWAFVPSRLRV
ncbi:hypothetical protein BKA67DRAFT_579146 [Truncatella angustata]|uniref:Uncharacterized protein n=1 Tax=Truncatella angustata TaxID=152316 RepID=A0A9P8ZTY3_9PEZI|nr:uncharacterized protein BKA67DRAFT_579146 [Truncatella angustata]KAH6647988.1 hypothetical protein BKA67DRAFT_579146 [Truncatella angustata]